MISEECKVKLSCDFINCKKTLCEIGTNKGQVFRAARKKGWCINTSKNVCYCPKHNKESSI